MYMYAAMLPAERAGVEAVLKDKKRMQRLFGNYLQVHARASVFSSGHSRALAPSISR